MKNPLLFLLRRIAPVLALILLGTGCSAITGQPMPSPAATQPPSPVAQATSSPTATPEPEPTATAPAEPTPEATAESTPEEEAQEPGILYRDDFTELGTGWEQVVFDNSYLGYHEPEWYHIEIQTANEDEIVTIPDVSLEDFTLEAEIFTETSLSQAEGDYRYGLVFRRSGNLFYAFTVSPVTREWFVLKGSPAALEVLQQGQDDSIQGMGAADTLRVDARGSDFFFHINGQPVGRVSDPDYSGGELGFLVQTLDNQKVHIHYDSVQVREVETPQMLCTVDTQAINLRSGPSQSFRILYTLLHGDEFEPLGRTADELWIRVKVDKNGETGWVTNHRPFVDCNVPISDLPVSEP